MIGRGAGYGLHLRQHARQARDAIPDLVLVHRRVAKHECRDAPPSTAGFLTGFAFRLGARRALDYATFFGSHDGELAVLKRNREELFGQCHMRAIRADWPALAGVLETLADVETAFRTALLAR